MVRVIEQTVFRVLKIQPTRAKSTPFYIVWFTWEHLWIITTLTVHTSVYC